MRHSAASDIAERAAIIEEGDKCDRATAEKRALAEFGFTSSNELADAHRAHILARLDELSSPNPDQNGRRLLKETNSLGHHKRASDAAACVYCGSVWGSSPGQLCAMAQPVQRVRCFLMIDGASF